MRNFTYSVSAILSVIAAVTYHTVGNLDAAHWAALAAGWSIAAFAERNT